MVFVLVSKAFVFLVSKAFVFLHIFVKISTPTAPQLRSGPQLGG